MHIKECFWYTHSLTNVDTVIEYPREVLLMVWLEVNNIIHRPVSVYKT